VILGDSQSPCFRLLSVIKTEKAFLILRSILMRDNYDNSMEPEKVIYHITVKRNDFFIEKSGKTKFTEFKNQHTIYKNTVPIAYKDSEIAAYQYLIEYIVLKYLAG